MLRDKKAQSTPLLWTVGQLSVFYINHRRELISHASRMLRSDLRAEEVVQEALVKVLLASPELESEEHALAYMHKVVENLCIDLVRAEGRRPNLVLLDDVQTEVESLDSEKDYSEIVAAADDAAIVRQALSLLSPSERAALVMWEIEGRSTSEIARELGIKETSVRFTVSKARASLRKILSEYIIDETRGLTALDLLSTTYKRSVKIAKKSTSVALSLILVFFAFLGFNNLTELKTGPAPEFPKVIVPQKVSLVSKQENSSSNSSSKPKQITPRQKTSLAVSSNAKAALLKFPGLDSNGVPIGFSVTDSLGSLGALYVNAKDLQISETGYGLSWVAKTISGAANIFLNQSLLQDSQGFTYEAMASYGKAGNWSPLIVRTQSFEVERLVSGNYLITASLQVKSEVETAFVIPAWAEGRDLEAAPTRFVTRILLNSSKTQVLGQAVQVIEKVTK